MTQTRLKQFSVRIDNNKRTTLKLEPEFIAALKDWADDSRLSVSGLVAYIARNTPVETQLNSAVRVALLQYYRVDPLGNTP